MRCIIEMKRLINFKTLILLLLASCLLLFCACGAEGDTAYDEAPNVDREVETTPETGDKTELTTVNVNTKIIRNVTMYGETKNFSNATETVKKQLLSAGGYVEASEITGGESLYNGSKKAKRAQYTLRIPAEKLDSFVESLEVLLNVTSYSETTKDVTLEYYDIESRIKTLETKKSALEALLQGAKTVEEITAYQNDLYDVIAEIESLRSKLNVYDNKVSYSTINLTVVEVFEYTETVTEEATFGDKIASAFSGSWEALGTFFEYLAIFLVGAFPVLLLLGAIAAIVLTIIWLVRRKKKKKS